MNMWKKTLMAGMLCSCVAGAFFMIGCKDDIEGNEQNNPAYIQAVSDREAGRYKEAAEGLINLLNQAPESAFLHKELASLYHDRLREYHMAIYHYERYLDLAKSLSSEDKRAFRDMIATCKKEAAKEVIAANPLLAGGLNNTVSSDDHAAEIGKLQIQLDRLNRYRELYHEQNKLLKQLQSEKAAQSAVQTQTVAQTQTAVQTQTPAAAASAPAADGEYDEYTVQGGDSLSKIARKTYGSAAKRYLDMIRTANNLKGDNIRLGQKLKLPKLK